jgi:diacylglycerol kinase family enzyme
VEIIRGRNIIVKRQVPGPVHLDGEPQITGPENHIAVLPNSLKVIVGSAYKK